VADEAGDRDDDGALYSDRTSAATDAPARIPPALRAFALSSWRLALRGPAQLERALGRWLTEPKAHVWFASGAPARAFGRRALQLDRRTRMLYDEHHVYINGESLRASGRDAQCLRRLADARELSPADVHRLSAQAREVVQQWLSSGWIHER